MKQLLHYHISPSKLSLNDLLKQTQGSCLPTLLPGKNLSLTKINTDQRLIEINGVLISQPDIFIQEQGFLTIHGVNAPFSSINAMKTVQQQEPDWEEFIKSPACGTESRNKIQIIQWNQVLRMLSSKGYVSFAIGLRSVHDKILNEYSNLDSVTIFAPMDFAYIASSSSRMLERIVRFHIMPEALTYNELVSMPLKTSLRTLSDGNGLEITEKGILGISINGVKITAPDVLSSKEFVVHGISQPFEAATFS
ncbi:Fasciclin-like arabinogalactan protein [Thalictrum thalictroides]|uniref:Fasciclin-like arabinogalactan protein n=1 Tax=Thalictrum thalictroides TaxID=46969 RepID=A0A7J6WHR9_THATH|nr:Fasciclin-like arabinogalactan protein [Thalictrum thalictroides]